MWLIPLSGREKTGLQQKADIQTSAQPRAVAGGLNVGLIEYLTDSLCAEFLTPLNDGTFAGLEFN